MIVESNTIWWHLTAGLHLSIFHEQIPASATHSPCPPSPIPSSEVNESFWYLPQMLQEGTDKKMEGSDLTGGILGWGEKNKQTE